MTVPVTRPESYDAAAFFLRSVCSPNEYDISQRMSDGLMVRKTSNSLIDLSLETLGMYRHQNHPDLLAVSDPSWHRPR